MLEREREREIKEEVSRTIAPAFQRYLPPSVHKAEARAHQREAALRMSIDCLGCCCWHFLSSLALFLSRCWLLFYGERAVSLCSRDERRRLSLSALLSGCLLPSPSILLSRETRQFATRCKLSLRNGVVVGITARRLF